MREIMIGDVAVSSVIERDGPWRRPEALFPRCDLATAHRHLSEMEDFVFDPASGCLVITYQTFVVRTPHHTILIDTCTGEDKGYPPPFDFPKRPWVDGLRALGLGFDAIDYVFCTHLHFDHCGWNTRLVDGRWVPTFPRAKYVFHRREYEFWAAASNQGDSSHGDVWRMNCLPVVEAGQAVLVEDDFALDDTVWLTPTPGHSPCHCCVNIRSGGRRAVVTGDLMHHALQCREPEWSTIFCWDPLMAAESRRRFLGEVADTDVVLLPVHFPSPTAGRIEADGARFKYRFITS
jgi:glyoxylase-like metal-dependent hydrolase (beta-lactamase superfamily II)